MDESNSLMLSSYVIDNDLQHRFAFRQFFTVVIFRLQHRYTSPKCCCQSYDQEYVPTNEAGTAINGTTTVAKQEISGGGIRNRGHLGPMLLTAGGDARFELLALNRISTPPPQPPTRRWLGTQRQYAQWHRRHARCFRYRGFTDALPPFTVADLSLDKVWNAPTGSLGLIYDLTHEWSLATSVATADRGLTFSDSLSTGAPVFATGVASVPSPSFDPGKCISYELSGRHAGEVGWGSLTGYYADGRDLSATQNDGTITVPRVGVVTAKKRVSSGRGYVTDIELHAGFPLHQPILDCVERFENPLDGIANLFDLEVVFALGFDFGTLFRVAATMPEKLAQMQNTPSRDHVPDAARVPERFRSTDESLGGNGTRLGTAYRLANGEIVNVPETTKTPNRPEDSVQ